jgi:hypothetical protein
MRRLKNQGRQVNTPSTSNFPPAGAFSYGALRQGAQGEEPKVNGDIP